MTRIFHPVKDREVEIENVERKWHTVRSAAKVDENEEVVYTMENQEYVEFTVLGLQHSYQDFMLLDDFKKHNPHVEV